MWDILGISAILNAEAEVHAPCGCGECQENLDLLVKPGQELESDWIVHFLVPTKSFWDKIGYT